MTTATAPAFTRPTNRISGNNRLAASGDKLWVNKRSTLVLTDPSDAEYQIGVVGRTDWTWFKVGDSGIRNVQSSLIVRRHDDPSAEYNGHGTGAYRLYLINGASISEDDYQAILENRLPLFGFGLIKVVKANGVEQRVLEFDNVMGKSSMFFAEDGPNGRPANFQQLVGNVQTSLFQEQRYLDQLQKDGKPIPAGLAQQAKGGVQEVSRGTPAPAPAPRLNPEAAPQAGGDVEPQQDIPF